MISLRWQDAFALITLDRPEALNALNRDMLAALDRLLVEVEASDARCIIITGAGEKAFCAGADIKNLGGRTLTQVYEGTVLGQRVFSRLATLRQPSIALINGLALGGGCELALACTFRLATSRARIGLPEIKLGLVPGFGGTQRLARLIGVSRALEIMMSGRFVDAQEANQIGLVNRVLPDGEPAVSQAIAFGTEFTKWSLSTQRLIREATTRGLDMSLSDGLELEAQLSTLSFQSEDGREGIAAFIAKRSPRILDA